MTSMKVKVTSGVRSLSTTKGLSSGVKVGCRPRKRMCPTPQRMAMAWAAYWRAARLHDSWRQSRRWRRRRNDVADVELLTRTAEKLVVECGFEVQVLDALA